MQEALALKPRPQVIWMQLGVRNDEAAALAEANGIKVVMNRCPKIEYGRLSSEIAWMGVNTRTISSRKAHRHGRHPAAVARPRRRYAAATRRRADRAERDRNGMLMWPGGERLPSAARAKRRRPPIKEEHDFRALTASAGPINAGCAPPARS